MTILFAADQFASDYSGGAELNDSALIELLMKWQPVRTIRCRELTPKLIDRFLTNQSDQILLGNFSQLSHLSIQALLNYPGRYSIIEHDHHYLKSRNPCLYKNGIAPRNEREFLGFYSNAAVVFCQTALHKQCLVKNKIDAHLVSLGCNFWPKSIIKMLHYLRHSRDSSSQNTSYAVVNSRASIKNTQGAIEYCQHMSFNTRILPSMPQPLFLKALSECKGLVFVPTWIESCSRLVVEASLLGLEIHANARIGILQEPWFLKYYDKESSVWNLKLFQGLWHQQVEAFALIRKCLTK